MLVAGYLFSLDTEEAILGDKGKYVAAGILLLVAYTYYSVYALGSTRRAQRPASYFAPTPPHPSLGKEPNIFEEISSESSLKEK